MRNYEGFIRRAVVIVPNDEEFKRRVAKREAEEGKDVPDSAVLEMKGEVNSSCMLKNFLLPPQHFFNSIYLKSQVSIVILQQPLFK